MHIYATTITFITISVKCVYLDSVSHKGDNGKFGGEMKLIFARA